MNSQYWSNLIEASRNTVQAFGDLMVAVSRNIADPLHDEVVKAKARLRLYDQNEQGIDKAIQFIRKLPPVFNGDRESFIEYASALQQFVIFGVDAYTARGYVKACVNAETLVPGHWGSRVRVLCRVIATGRLSHSDWESLSRTGITLPQSMASTNIHWTNLLPIIHQSLPYMQVEG